MVNNMEEKENKPPHEWGLDICPLRNKQCLRQQCAWWVQELKMCAVKKAAYPKV